MMVFCDVTSYIFFPLKYIYISGVKHNFRVGRVIPINIIACGLIVVTIISHIFTNIFPTEHILAVKFPMNYEKIQDFLYTKISKGRQNSEKSDQAALMNQNNSTKFTICYILCKY